MRTTWSTLAALAIAACGDTPGIVLCVDAADFQDGDEIELAITFAAAPGGPACEPIRRAASPLPYCVAATPGGRYGHAMALRAIWRRGTDEIGRRELVVPFDDERIVRGDVRIGDCCADPDASHQCLDDVCAELASTGLFDELVEPVECEK